MPKPWLAIAALLSVAAPAAAQERQPPYWASIASGEAMMRAGPGRNYPGIWLYKRRDLPIRVVKTYPNWRLIWLWPCFGVSSVSACPPAARKAAASARDWVTASGRAACTSRNGGMAFSGAT